MKKGRLLGLVCLATAMMLVITAAPVLALINLEKSQEWISFDDTIANGVFSGNVDGDGTVEIVTVGSATTSAGVTKGQLRIWAWSSPTLTLEKTQEFSLSDSPTTFPTTVALGVYAADVDVDGSVEIVTVGYAIDTSGVTHDHIVIWQWSGGGAGGSTLTKELDLSRVSPGVVRSVFAHQFDTSYMEIVIVGEDGNNAVVYVFTWNGSTTMTLVDSESWTDANGVQARSVYIEDIKGTSAKEIITGGYVGSGGNRYGQARVYDFASGSLSLADTVEWQQGGAATETFAVFAGVFHGATAKVAACGSFDNSGNLEAEVQILKWDAGSLVTDGNAYIWLDGATATQCRGVYAADLTSASLLDIVVGGYALISGTDNGEVRAFTYDGSSFGGVQYSRWTTTSDTRVHSVFAANVDSDGTVEFQSAGQAKDSHNDLNAQLRIWNAT